MKKRSFTGALLGSSSAVALSAAAIISSASPSMAANTITTGVFGGGSTLIAQVARQFMDCYMGQLVANDGFSFEPSGSPLVPGELPTNCSHKPKDALVEGLYAAVGSGSGTRAFIANDPFLLLQSPSTSAGVASFAVPAVPPPFVDTNNTGSNPAFGQYPYPEMDFGAADSPLPGTNLASLTTVSYANAGFVPAGNWQTTSTVTAPASSTLTVTYSTGSFGNPIQIPIAEVGVAIIVNTNNMTVNSASSTPTAAGGAIQLSTAQLCAIFSGLVTDWSDSSTVIPYLNKTNTPQTELFYADNINPTSTAAAVPYSSTSLPIALTYRSDGSGTSFITTNFLQNACPQLDPNGTYKYATIFGTPSSPGNLPSTTFANLKNNVSAVAGHSAANWVAASTSNGVAVSVGASTTNAGAIGYVSADFSSPYTTQVSGPYKETGTTLTNVAAPDSASLQNEQERSVGQYHPNTVHPFVAPTPTSVAMGWDTLTPPASTSSYTQWNVYTVPYASGTSSGGLSITGFSELGLPTHANAYPLVGTTFMYAYSCYNDPAGTRVPALTNMLAWLLGGTPGITPALPGYTNANNRSNPGFDGDVHNLIRNTGFHELPIAVATNLLEEYVIPSTGSPTLPGSTTAIAAIGATPSDGCTGVTGGAN